MEMSYGEETAPCRKISIDRIDSDKGYEVGNARLVCQFVNKMRSTQTDEEFCKFVKDIHRGITGMPQKAEAKTEM